MVSKAFYLAVRELQPSKMNNPSKVPNAISWKRLNLGSATVSIDFRAQENLLDKFLAKS